MPTQPQQRKPRARTAMRVAARQSTKEKKRGRPAGTRPPEIRVEFLDREIVVDGFAGAGGASSGIEDALGRGPDIAINHDAIALAVHAANHPKTQHLISNIWEVDPVEVCAGRPVGFAWFSPDCKHFSRAKGAKPVSKKIRSLAWVVTRWVAAVAPRVIIVENVPEFAEWGPLDDKGRPIKEKKGQTFRAWCAKIRRAGYRLEHRLIVAADYGEKTIRKRLYVIMRRDGLPIVFPEFTHGPGRAEPYETAAKCINWSIPTRSIFGRKKPLKEATLRRIAAGIQRYVVDAQPFVLPVTHQGDERVHGIDEPLRTVTAARRGEMALCQPFIFPVKSWGGGGNDARSIDEPMRTVTASPRGEFALCAPFVVRTAHGEANTKNGRPRWGRGHQGIGEPLGTVCASGGDFAVCAPFLVKYHGGERGDRRGQVLEEPIRTLDTSNRFALCTPFMVRHGHYSTITGAGLVEGCGAGTFRGQSLGQPLSTVCGTDDRHLVVPVIVPHYGGSHGHPTAPRSMLEPLSTITGRDSNSVACAWLTKLYGTATHGAPLSAPMPTVLTGGGKGGGHIGLVEAFLVAYYKGGKARRAQTQKLDEPMDTITTKARFGLVTIYGQEYRIVDIGMRMLAPEELAAAMGFRPDYDFSAARTKTKVTALIGNSVCRRVAASLVRANAPGPVGQLGLFAAA